MAIKPVHPRVVQAFVAISVTLAGLAAALPTSYGQTPAWSQPVPLSSPEGKSWFPDVAADAAGQVHVVWASATKMEERQGYDVVMYAVSSNGQTWSQAIDIAALAQNPGTEATRPTALVDQQGLFHLTFRYTDVFYLHAPVDSLSSTAPRLLPRRVSTANIAYFSRLAIDTRGRLHLVYTQMVSGEANGGCSGCYHLFYRWSDDGGLLWSAPTDVTNLPTGAAKPQMVIDGQGSIHLVWEAGPGGSYGHVTEPRQVMYAASHDGGKTWTSPVEFVAPGGRASNISLGLGGQDTLVVAWLGLPEDGVYCQFSRDGGRSWSPPQPIPGVWGGSSVYNTLLDDYAMATDSAGNVHLVLVGRTAADQKTLSVLHLTWDGSIWSKPEIITTLTGDVPEWPRIAVGLGNQLHVAWFVRDQEHVWNTDLGNYRIWYAHGVSSAPAATPVVWPTLTPIPESEIAPTATPAPTAVPSPTVTPTLEPGLSRITVSPDAVDSIYTDADDMMLLVKSLVPPLLIIAVVVVGVRLRRR
jgi:hypothetical protein